MNATAATVSKPRCACGLYFVEIQSPGKPEGATQLVGTGCKWNVETYDATFLRGHDAKLKSFLIKAGVQHKSIIWQSVNGEAQEVMSPIHAGNRYGFGYMVQAGIENHGLRKAKAAAKRAEKKAAKAEAPVEVEPQPESDNLFVKIGRWTYDVVSTEQVDEDTIRVTYLTKKGEEKVTEVAPYAIITA